MANKHRKACSASHPQGSTNENNKDATTPLLEQSKPRTPTPPTADEHREPEEQAELSQEGRGGQITAGVGGPHEQALVGKGSGLYSKYVRNLPRL